MWGRQSLYGIGSIISLFFIVIAIIFLYDINIGRYSTNPVESAYRRNMDKNEFDLKDFGNLYAKGTYNCDIEPEHGLTATYSAYKDRVDCHFEIHCVNEKVYYGRHTYMNSRHGLEYIGFYISYDLRLSKNNEKIVSESETDACTGIHIR